MTRSTTKCSRFPKSSIAVITLPTIMTAKQRRTKRVNSLFRVIFIIIISTIIGITIALFTWIVLKPIIRAIGWLISAATILGIIYLLLM